MLNNVALLVPVVLISVVVLVPVVFLDERQVPGQRHRTLAGRCSNFQRVLRVGQVLDERQVSPSSIAAPQQEGVVTFTATCV